MKTIKLNLYEFPELNEKAQELALNHFRFTNLDGDWWDFVFDDFVTIAGYLGICVEKSSIAFSGFYSQGDGSGFDASVDIAKLTNAITKQAWKVYAPNADFDFCAPSIDKRVLNLIIKKVIDLEPRIIKTGRYYSVIADFGGYPIEEKGNHDLIYGETDNLEKWLENIANVLNKFLYNALQDEYESLSSDEVVTDTIIANDWQFTSDGKFAGRLDKLALKQVQLP